MPDWVMLLVLGSLVTALAPAFVARSRGLSFWAFYALGIATWPVALVLALVLGNGAARPAPGPAASAVPAAPDDTAATVARLADLCRRGILTPAEFEVRRNALLTSPAPPF